MIAVAIMTLHFIWWFMILFGLILVKHVQYLYFCILVSILAILAWSIQRSCFLNHLENTFSGPIVTHDDGTNPIMHYLSHQFGISLTSLQTAIRSMIYVGLLIGFTRYYMIVFV